MGRWKRSGPHWGKKPTSRPRPSSSQSEALQKVLGQEVFSIELPYAMVSWNTILGERLHLRMRLKKQIKLTVWWVLSLSGFVLSPTAKETLMACLLKRQWMPSSPPEFLKGISAPSSSGKSKRSCLSQQADQSEQS